MYLGLMKYQHMAHIAVQENDMEMRNLHGKRCCHTTFTSTRQIMQDMGRTMLSSGTIWKRYILE